MQDYDYEILYDEKNGKEIDWKSHKIRSIELSEIYKQVGLSNKSIRVKRCGSYLEFKEYQDNSKKLYKADFCKVRLCPMCSWRRSLKIFGQVSKIMDYLTENYDYRYLFLTLTVKNVSGDNLSSEIDSLFEAFKALVKRKEFKKLSKGWFRCLEITHNWERDDYHPHFHVVIAVNKSYFTESGVYLSQKAWAQLWQSCLDVDYEPLVDVRTVRPDKNSIDNKYSKGVAEVAKYAVKSNDFMFQVPEGMENNDDVKRHCERLSGIAVLVFDSALHGRRLIAFGGIFKTIHKMLNLTEIDDDLVNTDNDDELREDLSFIIVRYGWNIGYKQYFKIFSSNS